MIEQEQYTEEEFTLLKKQLECHRDLWHSKRVTINDCGDKGVPDIVPLEDYYRDRLAENEYYLTKRLADRRRLISRKDSFKRSVKPSEHAEHFGAGAEQLHKSKGKLVRARHVIRVARQHSVPRSKDFNVMGQRPYHLYEKHTITKKEALHLFRIVESSSRLTTLKYHDVARRSWFLNLCRRAWETSGHRVLGTSLLDNGFRMLKKHSGIESYPFDKLESMLFPTPSSQFKESVKQLISQTVAHSPQEMEATRLDQNTVLICHQADQLNRFQIVSLFTAIRRGGGKLFLVEGNRKGMETDLLFDQILTHLNALDSKYSVRHYMSFAQKFIRDLQQPHGPKYEWNMPSLEL